MAISGNHHVGKAPMWMSVQDRSLRREPTSMSRGSATTTPSTQLWGAAQGKVLHTVVNMQSAVQSAAASVKVLLLYYVSLGMQVVH